MRPRLEGIWRQPDFVRLWLGQGLSLFGDRVTRTALPLAAVLTLGVSPGELSWLVIAEATPVLLIGLLAGVWIDRLRNRPLLIAADLARALLVGSIPAAAIFGMLGIWQLYVVAALLAVLTI